MTVRLLDTRALEGILPHRGVNLILDRAEISSDGQHARSYTRIIPGESRGRDLLARMANDGAAFYEPFIGECLALTGIPLIHDRLAAAGQTAVFSMVSRVSVPANAPLHGELVCDARIIRDRAGFTVYACKAYAKDVLVLDAEVMSGAAILKDIGAAPIRPLPDPTGTPIDRSAFVWKDPRLVFVERCTRFDAPNRRAIFEATYRDDHPFVPGHFPGQPVMMGMCQWIAIADAAWILRQQLNHPGAFAVNGTVSRPDGTQVLDVLNE